MKYIRYSQTDKIAFITIDRPTKLNALNQEALIELSNCWERFKEDDSAWVAVLGGTGNRAFCVGVDLEQDSGANKQGDPFDLILKISPRNHEISKPTICAIKGYCLGLGWWLAMECDLRVASTDARLGIPENRLNITAVFGGILTEHLPPAIALEILLTGEPLGSKRAYEMGFVNRLVEASEVEAETVQLARRICQNAPVSTRKTKELFYQSRLTIRNQSLALGHLMNKELKRMEDSQEGRKAFKEKRKPQWKGA